jgi:hypothetical protein
MDPEYTYGLEDDDLVVPQYDPSQQDYGYMPPTQQGIDPQLVQALASSMHQIAAETARQQLEGPLGRLTAAAEAQEEARLASLVDDAMSTLQERHPGTDYRDGGFLEFLDSTYSMGNAATPAKLASELERAHDAYTATTARERAASRKADQARELDKIRNASSSYRVGDR